MKAAVLGLLPLLSLAAELRIDHVTVAGRDLNALQSQLESAGIKVEYGGAHTNHATEMAIASFPDGSYIELIARQKSFDPAMLAQHPWAKFMGADAGPCAWAIRPKDFPSAVAALRAGGLPVRTSEGGRTRPGGGALLWETALLNDSRGDTFLPFLIRDITPREQRAYPNGKPANRDLSGVLRVVIAVRKIPDAFERFRAAYPDAGKPLKQVDAAFGAELAWIPDSPVIFASPLSSGSWLAERLEKFGESPCAFVLSSKKSLPESLLKARWFGRDLAWFDLRKLGWRLAVESHP